MSYLPFYYTLHRLVNLYSKWLDEDSTELELSQEQLTELKQQLKDITEKVSQHNSQLDAKSSTLQEKEERLAVSLLYILFYL